MSGQRGALDDAAELALQLKRILAGAWLDEDGVPYRDLAELFDAADDLANRIDNLRHTLRS
jgi:hypothetical protein